MLCYWPIIKNKTRNIMREMEFPQNLKNLSGVGRDQVIHLELVSATWPLSEMH